VQHVGWVRFLSKEGTCIVAGDIVDCTAAASAAGNAAIGVTLDVTDIASAGSMSNWRWNASVA
jgi:hypothetical protein